MAAKTSYQAFIVSFGAEDYFLDIDLARARAWKDRHVIQLAGDEIDDRELVGICETGSMDGGKRLVIVDEANKVKGDKALKAYIAGKDPHDDTIVLVAILRSEKCPEVWSQAAKKGRLFEHKKLKTWGENNEVVRWIDGEARRLGLVFDEGISALLFQLVGADLYRLSGELTKLHTLLGKGGKVGVEQVKLVVAPSPSAEPYQVAEAAFAKDRKKAMNLLSTVYRTMGEEAHVPITYSMIKQVEKITLARSLVDKGMAEDEIAATIGMHPWRCKTQFLPIVQKHPMKSLVGHMVRLKKLDVDVKSAARSKRTLVELAVLTVAV